MILISTLIAWLLSYYWMSQWLSGFAYKTDLSVQYFILPAAIMCFVLLLTTFIQTVRASNTNPVENLRDE
jgi:putative ABC transport system permease protein